MANKKQITNVLASRYASTEPAELCGPEYKIILEQRYASRLRSPEPGVMGDEEL